MLKSTSCVESNVTTTTSCCALQQYVSELNLTPGTILVLTYFSYQFDGWVRTVQPLFPCKCLQPGSGLLRITVARSQIV